VLPGAKGRFGLLRRVVPLFFWCNIRLIAKTSFQVRQSPSKDQTRERVHYGYITGIITSNLTMR
jgi:hypothetical protein